MRALALAAVLVGVVFAGAVAAVADGHFASADGPAVSIPGAGPVLHEEHGALVRGTTGHGRVALLVLADPRATREIARTLHSIGATATFVLDAVTIWQDRSLAPDLLGLHQELALGGLGANDDSA
ncbi:MAG TPA: hypothetical protein VKR80_10160, partial [Candidatus Limnocylindria bacterium]|nr:hypothetical protein [Candidatus Limnocylindria bacterium]